MGQKVNPHGLRVGVIKDWDSRWYAREDKVGDLVVEDYYRKRPPFGPFSLTPCLWKCGDGTPNLS